MMNNELNILNIFLQNEIKYIENVLKNCNQEDKKFYENILIYLDEKLMDIEEDLEEIDVEYSNQNVLDP